jgi:hypothetical protein
MIHSLCTHTETWDDVKQCCASSCVIHCGNKGIKNDEPENREINRLLSVYQLGTRSEPKLSGGSSALPLKASASILEFATTTRVVRNDNTTQQPWRYNGVRRQLIADGEASQRSGVSRQVISCNAVSLPAP